MKIMTLSRNYLFIVLLLCTWQVSAATFEAHVKNLGMQELATTFSEEKVAAILGKTLDDASLAERRSAAVLVSLGVVEADSLGDVDEVDEKVAQMLDLPAKVKGTFLGMTGDPQLYVNLATLFNHDHLLNATDFMTAFAEGISKKVITGYDIRPSGVFDDFPAGRTFTYSQSDLGHLRQLTALMQSEGISARVHGTPKVSAFVFREDWGPASDRVKTLPGGVRVVEGREVAMLFEFESPADRTRFHDMVTRYAKKDSADEEGLIRSAWWQPFYYTDTPLPGFEIISIIVMKTGDFEATLTVLPEKVQSVLDGIDHAAWDTEVLEVWVNRPFFRFLNGDYK